MKRLPGGLAGWSVVVAFVLIGIALMATVWATRSAVLEASMALRGGQALLVEHAVRADLAQLDELPTAASLEAIVADHAGEGLRYLAIFAGPSERVEAGHPAGTVEGDQEATPMPVPTPRSVRMVGGRLRFMVRLFGGPRGPHLRHMPPPWRAVIEVEPMQANTLREAASLSLGIGAIATASLLAVAIVLVRRESRRHADHRDRERQRRLASLGEMSAVLAHELRNPLASLKGNAQLLAQMLPSGHKPRAKAERVVEEALRLEKLTSDLLRFVRTSELRRAAVDPAALMREAVAQPRGPRDAAPAGASAASSEQPASEGSEVSEVSEVSDVAEGGDGSDAGRAAGAAAAGVATAGAAATSGEPADSDVELETRDAPPTWSLDADRLREVIVNLVENARAAGPPVRVTVSASAGRLRIDVTDRGPGVASEDRERIFEPFVTGKTQGTGLGLAVARRIVEAHGGTLEVHDHPGGGARFRVEVPEA